MIKPITYVVGQMVKVTIGKTEHIGVILNTLISVRVDNNKLKETPIIYKGLNIPNTHSSISINEVVLGGLEILIYGGYSYTYLTENLKQRSIEKDKIISCKLGRGYESVKPYHFGFSDIVTDMKSGSKYRIQRVDIPKKHSKFYTTNLNKIPRVVLDPIKAETPTLKVLFSDLDSNFE